MAIGIISSPASWSVGTVVAPAWAQGVQDNINGWLAGTNSMFGLVLDASGGLSASPIGGALKLGAIGSASNALPNTTIPRGALYGDSCILAWAAVFNNGASLQATQSFNIASLARPSTGIVNVNLNTALSSTSTGCPIACLSGAAGFIQVTITSTTQIHIVCTNTSNTATDLNFNLLVLGA